MRSEPTPPPTVTAVVISYNSEAHIAEAIDDLETALGHLDFEILVVDNASGDRTVEIAGEHIRHGRVIANHENAGYARAANIGLRNARGRFSLVMNDDARLETGAIDRLISVLDGNDEVALVGPRIVDANGDPTHSARLAFPGPGEELQLVKGIFTRTPTNQYPATDAPLPVSWLVAACVLGDTAILRRVGGFNESFFLYGEDIDLGRRLKEYRYLSVTVPDAVCTHVGEVSTSREYTADARTRRQVAGRGVYYRLWLSRPCRSLIYLRRALGLRGQPDRLKLFLPLAVWDGPSLRDMRFPEPLIEAATSP